MHRICVFCGSSPGSRPEYAGTARETGRLLASRGIGLVYGGGGIGLMGILADAALAAGGEVTGVIPRALAARELAHRGVTDLRIVETMHERKGLMADLADGFIALPGGLGTWEEFLEVLTWSQLGIHRKPCGLLNVSGYYAPLEELLRRGVEEGFVEEEHSRAVLVATSPAELLDKMTSFVPTATTRWLDRSTV